MCEGEWTVDLCPSEYTIKIEKDDLPENAKLTSSDTIVQKVEDQDISNIFFSVEKDEGGFNWWLLLIPLAIILLIGIAIAFLATRDEEPEDYYERNVEQV